MSVIDPGKASATARVISSSAQLWSIDYQSFNHFIAADPLIGFHVMKAMARILCRKLRIDNENRLHRANDMRAHFLDQDY